MNHGNVHIPYDMRCASCPHTASDHWYSDKGKLWSGECHGCTGIEGLGVYYIVCPEFKWDNLNYIEVMAERREQEKGLV